jgi:NAD(P)-dependent dehydrogenase (short-subunit alcohol dehydrogenase family)
MLRMPKACIIGTSLLGGAVGHHLVSQQWDVAGLARSDASRDAAEQAGAVFIQCDASDPVALRAALAEARKVLGGLDLVVNAASAARPPEGGPFGGGPLAEAGLDAFDGWTVAVERQAFVFLTEGARALREGDGGTLVQVTGGSSRRAFPGRGLWAAGAFGTRALVQAAAQEFRSEGIHVALLIVDATIESPKTEAFTRGAPRESLADQDEIAAAVRYLAEQGERAWTHELHVVPSGEAWTP